MPGTPWHRSAIAMTQKQSKLLLALGFPILMLLGEIKWNWNNVQLFFISVCSPGGALLSLFSQENPLSKLVPSLNEVAPDWLHMSSCTRKYPVPCLVLRAMQRIFFENIMFYICLENCGNLSKSTMAHIFQRTNWNAAYKDIDSLDFFSGESAIYTSYRPVNRFQTCSRAKTLNKLRPWWSQYCIN